MLPFLRAPSRPRALPLLLVCLAWCYGFLAATLVFLTPFLKTKLWVARLLVVTPFRLISKLLAEEVEKEVNWIAQARHGKFRASYAKMLKVAWGR